MEGILVRDLLVWPGAVIDRDGRHEGFKIQEKEGIPEATQKFPYPIEIDEFLPVKVGLDLKQLKGGKGFLWDVLQSEETLAVEIPRVSSSL